MSSRPGFLLYSSICATLLSVALIVSYYLSSLGMSIWTPISESAPVNSTVEGGESFGKALTSLPLDSSATGKRMALHYYGYATGLDRRMQQGRYEIGPDWSPAQILEQLNIGPNAPLKVILPPGITLREMAERIAEVGWVEEAASLIAVASGERSVEICGKGTMEGLFTPETYFFDNQKPPEAVIQTLFEQWQSEIEILTGTSDFNHRLRNGITLYDTIVLASLVEKEAASNIEMATVASVFHNRIRKNWPMGSSATLRYALNDWERGEHELPVNLKSPFNTNRKPGLPPHPICLPSREALSAAIHPPETPYFFFVAGGDGGTVFNVTHEDHIRAAQAYRRRMGESDKTN